MFFRLLGTFLHAMMDHIRDEFSPQKAGLAGPADGDGMARQPKKRWHREEIKAAVRMKGKTLTQLALDNGLHECACRVALLRRHHGGEAAIAAFLRIPAAMLWPGRYRENGTPRTPRYRKKATPSAEDSTSQKSEAA